MDYLRLSLFFCVFISMCHAVYFVTFFFALSVCQPPRLVLELQSSNGLLAQGSRRYDLWADAYLYGEGVFQFHSTINGIHRMHSLFVSSGILIRAKDFLLGTMVRRHVLYVGHLVLSGPGMVSITSKDVHIQSLELNVVEQLYGPCWFLVNFPVSLFFMGWLGILLTHGFIAILLLAGLCIKHVLKRV